VIALSATTPDAAPRSWPGRLLAHLRGRLAAFHGEREGQVLPLVFFLGLSFFVGVGLVVNTGKTVNRRIESQDAVDAAAVSGVTSLARGMNYLARNNVTMTKVLASIVVVRSFEPAIKASKLILKGWGIAAEVILRVGQALSAIPFPPGISAVGYALELAGTFIKAKVKQENRVLDQLLKIARKIAKKWDNEIKTGKMFGLGKGWGWKAVKGMSLVGDVLAYGTPILAQLSAKTIYAENLGAEKGTACWMLPLYPGMPVCKGPFSSFAPEVTRYINDNVMLVIDVAGWTVLTLSMFPLTYRGAVIFETAKIFLTVDGGVGSGASLPTLPVDPDQARMDVLGKEVDEREKAIEKKKNRVVEIKDTLLPAKEKEVTTALAARDAIDKSKHLDDWNAADKAYEDRKKERDALKDEQANLEKEIEVLRKEIEERNTEMTEISNRRKDGQKPKIDGGIQGGLGDVVPGIGQKFLGRKFHPYLLDPGLDEKQWGKRCTFFTLAWRDPTTNFLPGVYPAAKFPLPSPIPGLPLDTKMFTYAAARLYSPHQADLWTADWSAKLVRAELGLLPSNPIAKLPAACAAAPAYFGAYGELNLNLQIDIFGWVWDLIDMIDFPWPDWKFDIDWSLALPEGPGALGKH